MTFTDFLDQEIAAQERQLAAHPAFIKLQALRATRELYVVAETQKRADADGGKTVGRNPPPPRASVAPLGGKSLEAVNAVVEVLRETGRPLRTAELLPRVNERGIYFKGNAPQNILSSLLSRSTDVVSKGGHVGWALAEWDSAGGGGAVSVSPPADVQPEAQGREAGPGGGT